MSNTSFHWNETIQKMNMKKLGMSDEEIADVLEKDREIEKGGDPFPLSSEAKKASKQARQVGRAPTAYKFQKRERKADNAKRELIELLQKTVAGIAENVEVINVEREITFYFNEKKYKIVLSAPRS